VSVLVPAFNTAPYVGAAIESCLAQTLEDIEVIVVDDGSTDGSGAVARGSTDDPRVTVVESPANEGVSNARNRALDRARGTWIATLDSDDWMRPDRLETLVTAGRSFRADMVGDDVFLVHDGETEPYGTLFDLCGEPLVTPRTIDVGQLIDHEVGGTGTLRLGLTQPIIRRELLARHDIRWSPALRVGEDFLVYLECLLQRARWIMVPTAHYLYRRRPRSATATSVRDTTEAKLAAARALHARLRDRLEPAGHAAITRYERNLAGELAYRHVVEVLKQGHWRASARALVHHPRALTRFAHEAPTVVRRRFDHRVRRDPHAFDMLPGPRA
jgi:succinoglycan biosynthesis protein ExoO